MAAIVLASVSVCDLGEKLFDSVMFEFILKTKTKSKIVRLHF